MVCRYLAWMVDVLGLAPLPVVVMVAEQELLGCPAEGVGGKGGPFHICFESFL